MSCLLLINSSTKGSTKQSNSLTNCRALPKTWWSFRSMRKMPPTANAVPRRIAFEHHSIYQWLKIYRPNTNKNTTQNKSRANNFSSRSPVVKKISSRSITKEFKQSRESSRRASSAKTSRSNRARSSKTSAPGNRLLLSLTRLSSRPNSRKSSLRVTLRKPLWSKGSKSWTNTAKSTWTCAKK